MLLKNLYVIKEMVNVQRAIIELYMHLGGLLSTLALSGLCPSRSLRQKKRSVRVTLGYRLV